MWVKSYDYLKLLKLFGKTVSKPSVIGLKHAKRGPSSPFYQNVKAWKLSGMMFSSQTQEHEPSKPIMNDIFFNFLTAILKYSSDYIMVMVSYNQEV